MTLEDLRFSQFYYPFKQEVMKTRIFNAQTANCLYLKLLNQNIDKQVSQNHPYNYNLYSFELIIVMLLYPAVKETLKIMAQLFAKKLFNKIQKSCIFAKFGTPWEFT